MRTKSDFWTTLHGAVRSPILFSSWRSRTMAIEYAIPKSLARPARVYDLGLQSGAVPRKVAMLANGFPDADKYLAKQAEALAPHWPGTHFRISKKAGDEPMNDGP